MSSATATTGKTKRFGRRSFSISNPFSRQGNQDKDASSLRSLRGASELGEVSIMSSPSRRASLQLRRRDATPGIDERTITRRKQISSPSPKPANRLTRSKTVTLSKPSEESQAIPVSISSSMLRPKTTGSTSTTSSLPKYKPRVSANSSHRLAISEAGSRKRTSMSDAVSQSTASRENDFVSSKPADRPISPLPRRVILRAINGGSSLPLSPKGPRTYPTPSAFSPLPSGSSSKARHRRSPAGSSPVVRRPKTAVVVASPVPPNKTVHTTNSSSNERDEAKDEKDVSFLLGSIASPSKPTPSIPRTYVGQLHKSAVDDNDKERRHPEVQEDPFLSPFDRSFASPIKTPTLTRMQVDMQTPGLLSRMTAPFGMTPETDLRLTSPSSKDSLMRKRSKDATPSLASADTSLELSKSEILDPIGYTPEIRRTDEAITTLLKIQIKTLEEQLDESKKQQECLTLRYQEQIGELEGKLIDLADQHQSEINAQRLLSKSLDTKLAERDYRHVMPERLSVLSTWQQVIEVGTREVSAIRERRETLRILLSSFGLVDLNW